MKVILIWTAMLGMIIVVIVGCGSDDSPIKEEMPQPLTEPSVPYISPILGTWHLKTVIAFENGVERQQLGLGPALFTLIFKPDKTFEAIQRFPLTNEVYLEILKQKGLEHVQRIIITFWGKFEIDEKQLLLDVDRAMVEPKEAPEIDSDFEDPMNFFFWVDDTGRLNYSLSDDGDHLELEIKQGVERARLIYYRIKPL